jgi:glutaredoxin
MVEKIQRKINYKIHVTALIITIIVFSAGIYTGTVLSRSILEDVSHKMKEGTYERIHVLELMTFADDPETLCPFLIKTLDEFDEEAYKIGLQLGFLEDYKNITDEGILDNYYLLELRNYYLSKKITNLCKERNISTLYFFSKNCPSCMDHGKELIKARMESNTSVRVYTFNADSKNELVKAIVKKYGINEYPTTIINEQKIIGAKNKQELLNLIKENS